MFAAIHATATGFRGLHKSCTDMPCKGSITTGCPNPVIGHFRMLEPIYVQTRNFPNPSLFDSDLKKSEFTQYLHWGLV